MKTKMLAATILAGSIVVGLGAPAFSDPVTSTSLGYIPTSGQIGESFDVMIDGCTNGGNPVYMGGYMTTTGSTDAPVLVSDLSTTGSWTRHVQLDSVPGLDVEVHAFCASAPVTSIDDPNVLWISAPLHFTVVDTPNVMRANATASPAVISAATSPLSVDPDALPLVDRMGIPGAQAAALKVQVDSNVTTVGQVSRLFQTFFGRPASTSDLQYWVSRLDKHTSVTTIANKFAASSEFKRLYGKMTNSQYVDAIYNNALGHPADAATNAALTAQLTLHRTSRALVALQVANSPELQASSDDANYIITAYQVLAGRAPTADEITAQLNLLESGLVPRVQVVENIALATRKTVATAIRHAIAPALRK